MLLFDGTLSRGKQMQKCRVAAAAIALSAGVALWPAASDAEDSGPIALPLDAAPTSVLSLAPYAGYEWQNLPRFQTGSATGGSSPIFTKKPTVSGPGGGITAGFFLPPTWPQFGSNSRLELQGHVFDLTDKSSRSFPSGTLPGSVFIPIGGSGALGTGGLFSDSLKTEYQGYYVQLRAATDIPLMPAFAITPAAGIFGSNTNGTFNYDDTEACGGGGCFREFVHESVNTDRIGGTLSLGMRFGVAPGFSLIGGISGSLFGAWSQLNGQDCFTATPINVACGSGGAGNLFLESAVQNRKSRLAGQVGAQAGFRYNPGWVTVDLLGGFDWDSAVPGVSNPVTAGQMAVVRYNSEVGYSARLQLTFPFGGGGTVTPAAAPAPPPPPPPASAPQRQVFIVFFEFDKSSLTADGRRVVDAAAAAFKSGKAGVAIAGYTDLAGTQQYNLALSKRRADTVKQALVRDGVPAAAIDEKWFGKQNPRVPTADGVREPQNRRVEITM
jgi:outer membrane protein OmpA-like peptidoglycan-associated protein